MQKSLPEEIPPGLLVLLPVVVSGLSCAHIAISYQLSAHEFLAQDEFCSSGLLPANFFLEQLE